MVSTTQGSYAAVNGLDMYYEVHGEGQPLLLLHGGMMTIDLTFDAYIPRFAERRQVIAIEQQGHGRTADIDRPFSYEQMADDSAGLVRQLGIDQIDVLGYSMGGGIGLKMAIRHPDLVRKLVVVSMPFNIDGYVPGISEAIQSLEPAFLDGSPLHEDYVRLAPNPDNWSTLVARAVEMEREPWDMSADAIRAIAAPTQLIFGDSDGVRLEHVAEMFRLRGGDVSGDLVGLPVAQLAVLPGCTHVSMMERVDWIVPMVTEFLDAPMPDAG